MKRLMILIVAMMFVMTGCESGLTNDTEVTSEGHTEIDADNASVYYNEDNSTEITYNQYIFTNVFDEVETNEFEEIEE